MLLSTTVCTLMYKSYTDTAFVSQFHVRSFCHDCVWLEDLLQSSHIFAHCWVWFVCTTLITRPHMTHAAEHYCIFQSECVFTLVFKLRMCTSLLNGRRLSRIACHDDWVLERSLVPLQHCIRLASTFEESISIWALIKRKWVDSAGRLLWAIL